MKNQSNKLEQPKPYQANAMKKVKPLLMLGAWSAGVAYGYKKGQIGGAFLGGILSFILLVELNKRGYLGASML